MYLTGFADEAADDIDGQIRATRELGWHNIESRNINGRNLHDIPDAEFDEVRGKLEKAGVRVNCFGSAIANWSKKITEPPDSSLAEVKRAIPRMKALGTKLIRIMSFAVLPDRGPEDQREKERFKRVREIWKMFDGEGLVPVHENCMNYGGMGWPFMLKLLDQVPGLKVVFDTGNPVFNPDRSQPKPWPKQDAWEFYAQVREFVAHVHVKDARWDPLRNETVYTYPGEGAGQVRRILKDLLDRGYDAGISIEPHLAVVFHDAAVTASAQAQFDTYVEYGRRLMRLLAGLRAERGAGKTI